MLTLRRRRWKQSERLTREAAILAKFDRSARSTRARPQVFIGYSLYRSGRTDIFCLRKEITIYYDPWSNPDALQAATLSLDDADWLSPSRVEICGQILGLEAHHPSLLTLDIGCSRYLGGKCDNRDKQHRRKTLSASRMGKRYARQYVPSLGRHSVVGPACYARFRAPQSCLQTGARASASFRK